MLFSQIAWNKSEHIYKAIINHPFNKELMRGNLSQERFGYYIEQDSIFLKDFSRSLAMIAARSQSISQISALLKFSQGALIAEQEIVHQFFQDQLGFADTGKITSATLAYTSYLLHQSALESVEVGVASVLPCFWVYREVGLHIAKNAAKNNPFDRWISNYSSEEYSSNVNEVINIFDTLAAGATETTRNQMCEAFYKCCVLEWHFWQDAYEMQVYDDIGLEENKKKFASSNRFST